MIESQTALLYTMVMVSAADNEMSDSEITRIGEIVRQLPVFKGFDDEQMATVAQECAGVLAQDNGLELALEQIRNALPDHLRETAYVLACDIAIADLKAEQEELRLLEMLRHTLEIDRLSAAAIERAARARYATA
ncbi:MAG: tellurite resistance TerB family protein [Alphaproteobacteria bacterium]|jgi:tellurite resistance protein|nr:tellurite resistance TerB family protein [Alphaproteobacteria bacterium]